MLTVWDIADIWERLFRNIFVLLTTKYIDLHINDSLNLKLKTTKWSFLTLVDILKTSLKIKLKKFE